MLFSVLNVVVTKGFNQLSSRGVAAMRLSLYYIFLYLFFCLQMFKIYIDSYNIYSIKITVHSVHLKSNHLARYR